MPPRYAHGGKGFAPKGTLKRLLKDVFKNYKWHLLIVMVCLAINSATNFSASIFIKNFTNTLTDSIKSGDIEGGWKSIIGLAIALGSIYVTGIASSLSWILIPINVEISCRFIPTIPTH